MARISRGLLVYSFLYTTEWKWKWKENELKEKTEKERVVVSWWICNGGL